MSPSLYHESKSRPYVQVHIMNPSLYHESKSKYLKVQGKVQCILKLPKNQLVQGIQRVPKVPRCFKGTLMSKVMSKVFKVLVKVQGI